MTSEIKYHDEFNDKVKNINILFQFIKNNKYEQFLEYISTLNKTNLDVNMKDDNGNYLITLAILINNRKIVKILIEFGSRLDFLDPEGYSILYYPIKFNYIDLIDILLEYNKEIIGISLINIKDFLSSTPLFYCVKFKNNYALQELINNNADVNYSNNQGINVLHMAIIKKNISMITIIINYIKNIDKQTNKGMTALHFACSFQLPEIVKLLLTYNASTSIVEYEYNFTPIFYAVAQNNIEIVKILVKNNINPNQQDYIGNTILHYAISLGFLDIFHYIIVSYPLIKGDNLIYFENINNTVKNSNAYYINPNLVNLDGLTFLHMMLYNYSEHYDKYIIKILEFIDVNYQDNSGNTILYLLVVLNIWQKFTSVLEKRKLNIFIVNNENKDIYSMISEKNNFIALVAKSYYNYLLKYENAWEKKKNNQCSKRQINEIKCLEYIKTNIINTKKSVPDKKNKIIINIDNDAVVQYNTFDGTNLDIICGYKYLIKKFPHAMTIFSHTTNVSDELKNYQYSIGVAENSNQYVSQFEIVWIYQKIFYPDNFDEIINNIISKVTYKFIIINLAIILSNGNHANCLLYNIENYTLERFEPHGSGYPTHFNYNPDFLDSLIYSKFKKLLESIYNKEIILKYYPPNSYLPKIGFQTFENAEISINKNIGDPNGFCALWCIWYLDYRLRYHNIRLDKFIKKMFVTIRSNRLSFRTLIRNYSIKITSLRDKYLSFINKTFNDYLNNRITHEEIKKLLTEILID